MDQLKPLTLDVRPLCAQGKAPLGTILDAVDKLQPGQSFYLLTPFEPKPLLGLLKLRGFSHKSKPLGDDSWEVTFFPRKP